MGRFLLLVACLALVSAVPHTARAEEPANESEEPPGYGEAVEAALTAHAAGQYELSREHMLRAHGIFPSARTLRGLGKVEFELEHYVDALAYLEAALDSQVKPLDVELRADVEDLRRQALGHVGEVHIAVDPPGASVVVDRGHTRAGPALRLLLPAGDHVLEVRAEARATERLPLSIRGGERTELRVVLEPLVKEQAPALAVTKLPAAPRQEPPRRALRKNPWLWVAAGVLAGGAAAAFALGGTRETRERERAPVTTPNTLPGVTLEASR